MQTTNLISLLFAGEFSGTLFYTLAKIRAVASGLWINTLSAARGAEARASASG